MPGPWLSDDQIRDALADVLNLEGGRSALADYWAGIVPRAHTKAYNQIVAYLVQRGFTIAQLDTWDAREGFESDLSLWWCLVEGESEREGAEASARPTMVPRLLFKFDRRPDLVDPLFGLTANGVLMVPPSPAAQARIAFGTLDSSKDIFQLDPDQPNPWEPGYTYRR